MALWNLIGSALTSALSNKKKNETTSNTNTYTGGGGSSGGSGTTSTYKPLGTHFDATITGNNKEKLNEYGNQYNTAKAAGDDKGMAAAHAAAEALRMQYGYSGGVDGSDYIAIPLQEQKIYKPSYDFTATANPKPVYNEEVINNSRPTEYESKYDSRIDDVLNQYLNRDKFSYDVTKDPLYEQYKAQYLREGNRAMNDTMASAAANAGGMNSYAMTAAQQANNYYNAQLTDKVPELYQLAYGMYLDDIDQQIQDLNILQNMDSTQYNRYRDTMSDWRNDQSFAYNMYRDQMGDWSNDRNFAYGQYRDQMGDYYNDRDFQYGAGRDDISDQRYNTEWDYNVGRDQVADDRYQNEWDYNVGQDNYSNSYNQAMNFLQMGVMPSASVLAKAGITTQEAQSYINSVKAKNTSTSGSGRTGNTSSGTGTGTGTDTGRVGTTGGTTGSTADGFDGYDMKSVSDAAAQLGMSGIPSKTTLDRLISMGRLKAELGSDGIIRVSVADNPLAGMMNDYFNPFGTK